VALPRKGSNQKGKQVDRSHLEISREVEQKGGEGSYGRQNKAQGLDKQGICRQKGISISYVKFIVI
jgi:hypothetical protein